jgi:hypothetical protein
MLWDLEGRITASQWLLVAAFSGLCLSFFCQAIFWFKGLYWLLPAGVNACILAVACASLTLAVVVRSNVAGRLATTRVILGSDFYASIFFITLCIGWGFWALLDRLQEREQRRKVLPVGPTHYHRGGERCKYDP